MLKKTIRLLYVQLFFSLVLFNNCYADDNNSDDFDDDDLSLEMLQEWEHEHIKPRTSSLPPGVTLAIIASKVSKFIKSPLWKKTTSSRGRDILFLFPNRIFTSQDNELAVSFFYNMTHNLQASFNGLIDLENAIDTEQLLEEIFTRIPFFNDQTSITEISSILPLFTKISVQERKGGFFLQKRFELDPFEIEIHTMPFGFAERNFWLSATNQKIITDLGNKIFPGQTLNQNEAFRMRFGPGDTRVQIGVKAIDKDPVKLSIGTNIIFPTGSIAHKTRLRPIDIHSEDYLGISVSILQNMRDYFLDASLGNRGHFGFGAYLKSTIPLIKNLVNLHCQFSYDTLLPAHEDRLFAYKKTLEPSDINPINYPPDLDSDEKEALAKELLKKFLPQYLILLPFKVNIAPGDIFNATTAIKFGVNHWRWSFGYDFYLQQREKMKEIYNTDDQDKLRIDDATIQKTSQHKIFSETSYIPSLTKADLHLCWGSNWTVRSRGLGHDWTLYFKVMTKF